jgi:hypothetical protein
VREDLSIALEEVVEVPDRAVPVLHGERVRLRPVEPRDAERLAEILAHPGVAEWWPGFDLDRVRREITGDADGQVIGLVQYAEEDDPDYRHAGIDVTLHARARATASPSTRPSTTSARSAPTCGLGSAPWVCCAATSAARTAPGTTGC